MISDYKNSFVTSNFLKHFSLKKQKPSLTFLSQIISAFLKIPYENLTKIVKAHQQNQKDQNKLLRLPDEIWNDFLEFNAGGTCFSLCFFLYHLLDHCEFKVCLVMADRTYGANTHSALIVELNEIHYLLDPGFLVEIPIALNFYKPFLIRQNRNFLEFVPDKFNETLKVSTIEKTISKFRYLLKLKPVDLDEFENYWKQSFKSESLSKTIVTFNHQGNHFFIKNDVCRIKTAHKIIKIPVDQLDKLGDSKLPIHQLITSKFALEALQITKS